MCSVFELIVDLCSAIYLNRSQSVMKGLSSISKVSSVGQTILMNSSWSSSSVLILILQILSWQKHFTRVVTTSPNWRRHLGNFNFCAVQIFSPLSPFLSKLVLVYLVGLRLSGVLEKAWPKRKIVTASSTSLKSLMMIV